jgi:outer membrane protein TolC
MKISSLKRICFLLGCIYSNPCFALTLNEYLVQVQTKNKGQIGIEKQAEAAGLKWYEGDLIFTPQFFVEARVGSDGKPANPPFLTYDKINIENYSAGFSQQFTFGLQGRLYYQFDHTKYVNAPLLNGLMNDFYDTRPILEFSMPLWKNGFGRAAKAQQSTIQESNRVEEYNAIALSKSTQMDAENTYWALTVAREVLRIQVTALHQAESILNYVSKKAHMKLGEDGDILQAEALVASRKLELRKAESEEQLARKNFNAMRGLSSDEVADSLDLIPYDSLQEMKISDTRPADRYDIKSAEAQVSLAVANSKLIEERNKPSFEIYGNYALNGRSATFGDAVTNLSTSSRVTQFIGFRFNMPLDFSAASKARSGARLTEEAQQEQYVQKKILQDRDWKTLVQRFSDSKDALLLANRLVEAQTKKLKNENVRLKQGRATTYQVLLFEQDQSQAELMRVQLTQQILAIRSSVKLYQSQSSGEK